MCVAVGAVRPGRKLQWEFIVSDRYSLTRIVTIVPLLPGALGKHRNACVYELANALAHAVHVGGRCSWTLWHMLVNAVFYCRVSPSTGHQPSVKATLPVCLWPVRFWLLSRCSSSRVVSAQRRTLCRQLSVLCRPPWHPQPPCCVMFFEFGVARSRGAP